MATKTILTGKQLDKDDLIFEVLGSLDELSAVIGLAKVKAGGKQQKLLSKVQKDLILFSSILAQNNPEKVSPKLDWLEEQIKIYEKKVDVPKKFVLSGESELEVRLNLVRVAVRKAERRAVSLNRHQKLPEEFLDYLNRLSWFLFLLAISN